MTSINGVGGPRGDGDGDRGRMTAVLSSVGSLLGLSNDDLKSQMASGKSLADIASSKGVSTTQLTDAIKQGLQQAGGPDAPSADRLDAQATRIANHHRHHHHQHGHGPGNVQSSPGAAATPGSPSSPSGTTIDQFV